MHLQLKQLTSRDQGLYEKFVALHAKKDETVFFHTWEWGENMRAQARAFERVGIYDGRKLVAVGQLSLMPLTVGTYWYCPRGLVVDYYHAPLVTAVYDCLRTYYQKRRGAAFLRVDPAVVRGAAAEQALDVLRPNQARIFTQAERVWLVDLQKDEPQLLSWLKEHGMRKNVAYYLRKAAKAGVTVRISSDPQDLEQLIDLLQAMHVRKGGVGMRPAAYYRNQFAVMAPAGYERVCIAEKDGAVLAAALIGIFGTEASYLHAASADLERSLSAPHYLLYETMKFLQEHHPHVQRFNFWGIVSDKNRHHAHPRYGYSKFKRSFGGYKRQYIRSRDFVYKPSLWMIAYAVDSYRTWKYKND